MRPLPVLPEPAALDRMWLRAVLLSGLSASIGAAYLVLAAELDGRQALALLVAVVSTLGGGVLAMRPVHRRQVARTRAWLAAPTDEVPLPVWVEALNYPWAHSRSVALTGVALALVLAGFGLLIGGPVLAVHCLVGGLLTDLLATVFISLYTVARLRSLRRALSARSPLLPLRHPDVRVLELPQHITLVVVVMALVSSVMVGTLAWRGAARLQQGEIDLPLLALELALVSLAGTALSLVGVVAAVRQALEPVTSLDHLLTDLTPDRYHHRVQVSSADEIGRLGLTVNRMLQGLEERERLQDAFGRYVARQVGEAVLRGDMHLGGELLDITILMADIRGFTPLSEQLSPPQVVELLNRYFTHWVGVVAEHGGFVDKFIGDAIMVVFGAPERLPPEQSALRAATCALAMQARLDELNDELRDAGLPPLRIGIGIHTGEAVVGNIGATERMEYTAIGDAVNTTARIESATKDVGADILISGKVWHLLGDRARVGDAHLLQLKGKAEPVECLPLYEVLG